VFSKLASKFSLYRYITEPTPVTDARLALVTGGAGFIGSNLVELLLKLGLKVRVFDNLSTGFKEYVPTDDDRVEFIEGDVRNYAEVRLPLHSRLSDSLHGRYRLSSIVNRVFIN
jgi:dTDP-D-glucose 4,6-dehydratase